MDWLEISVSCEPEHAEAVAEVLARYVPGGVAIQQNALDLTGDEWQPDGPLEPLVSVRAYLPHESGLEEMQRRVDQALWHLRQIAPIPAPQFRIVAEEQWASAWKEHFQVTRIGERFVIKPSWRDHRPQESDVVIELDPGMAFGTGLHPTTQMCLLALERHLQAGDRVLDLGTGSGILAIAATKLGAANCLALDVDPVAVEVARANVCANGANDAVRVEQGTLAHVSTSVFDLALVNILAKVIVELCGEGLGAVVRPGGLAVFAGLIDTQEAGVCAALEQAGFEMIERSQEKDWVGLVCRKRLDLTANP